MQNLILQIGLNANNLKKQKMETIGEILTHQNPMQPRRCNRPKVNAELVYDYMIEMLTRQVLERGKQLILNELNKYVIGQVSLWYANDERFKGDLLKGLMIRGSVGTGKTMIVKALIKTMFQGEKIHAAFIHSTELQELYMTQNENEIQRFKILQYVIIDDVGVEMVEAKSWGNTREPFNDLFDYRYRENKTTIITTNLKPSDIENQYGTRIRDRFRESFNDLLLDGESLRK
jgi:hypothetical protein